MAETNSTLIKSSRYVSGGITEVNSQALEWWERNKFQQDASDRTYVVEARFNGRLDLIATSFLENSRLWWIIAQYNSILDPFNEIVEGRVLYIPTISRVQQMLNGKLGGVDSTREIPLTNITPIV